MQIVGNFKTLRNAASTDTEILIFTSKEFRCIRYLLRLLSLWRPRSAGILESFVYPVFVNLLLFISGIGNSFRAAEKSTFLNVQMLYIVHEVVVWLGHILGNRYFTSRDLETNALEPEKPLVGIKKLLNRRLKILNFAAVTSMIFFSIMLCVLFVVTRLIWNEGDARFSAKIPNVHGLIDHILYFFVLFSIIYNLGVGLALSWTLALLYSCYASRLKILENRFLKWKHSSVEAVSLFQQLYARPVKKSWKRLSWWFLAHNIVALAIPLYGYELAQAISGHAYHTKHLPQFICYLIFIVTIWLTPTVMGELIKRRERKFIERINETCPWLVEDDNRSSSKLYLLSDSGLHSLGESQNRSPSKNSSSNRAHRPLQVIGSTSTSVSECDATSDEYTFASRGKELKTFLRFLNQRTLGLVSRGYSFQLNLSLLSLTGAAISFLIELNSINSNIKMYTNCNGTISQT